MNVARLPTLFVSHGGGPWPYIEEMKAPFAKTAAWLANFPSTLSARPKAVVSVSGHWEARDFTVSTSARPPMIYDYSGFPAHTYQIKYEAPGSPAVAGRVRELLLAAGMACDEDPEHGFDHGTFVPMGLMFPQADVPIVSLSLRESYDPEEHLRAGRALSALRDEGVLIVGSGLSYHNLRAFRTEAAGPVSDQFEKWLTQTVLSAPKERARRLIDWQLAPSARLAHPQEDHLIPLMIAAGAAGEDAGRAEFVDRVWGVKMASYRFG